MNKRLLPIIAACLMAITPLAGAAPQLPPAGSRYAYGSAPFNQLLDDSYRQIHATDPQTFYEWMDKDCQRIALGRDAASEKPMPGWMAILRRKRSMIERAKDPALKARDEKQLAAWLHKTIKAGLPHFSLDEGFEFTNAVRKGERQCVLQATLMAALLQAMDVDAGVVMVYKNIAGQASNNGHAVTLMKCADGKDVLVDCSDPKPFVRHKGLFVKDAQNGTYRYVEPVFDGPSATIVAYHPDSERERLDTSDIEPLDYRFVRSQIEYYRGERTPGGLLAAHPTWDGLEKEAQHLRTSVEECPQNPLATYMLGRVYLKEAKTRKARRLLTIAYVLYARFGRVPQGCRDAIAEARMSLAKS